MEQRKQTAVEWLISQVEDFYCLLPVDMTKQAQKIERSQIEESYSDGFDDGYLLANGEDTKFDDCYLYYHETYGK